MADFHPLILYCPVALYDSLDLARMNHISHHILQKLLFFFFKYTSSASLMVRRCCPAKQWRYMRKHSATTNEWLEEVAMLALGKCQYHSKLASPSIVLAA